MKQEEASTPGGRTAASREAIFHVQEQSMLSRGERRVLFGYRNYEVFAYGTYRPGKDVWLASVKIRRKNGSVAEQNFHDYSIEFESHVAAEHFAREYARRLIDGAEPGLNI